MNSIELPHVVGASEICAVAEANALGAPIGGVDNVGFGSTSGAGVEGATSGMCAAP